MNRAVLTVGTWDCSSGYSLRAGRLRKLIAQERNVDIWLLQGVPSITALERDLPSAEWGYLTTPIKERFKKIDTVTLYKEGKIGVESWDCSDNTFGERTWLGTRRPKVRLTSTLFVPGIGSVAVGNLSIGSGEEGFKQVQAYMDWAKGTALSGYRGRCVIGGSWGRRYFSRIWGDRFWRELRMTFAQIETRQVTRYSDLASNLEVVSRREVNVANGNNAVIVRYKI